MCTRRSCCLCRRTLRAYRLNRIKSYTTLDTCRATPDVGEGSHLNSVHRSKSGVIGTNMGTTHRVTPIGCSHRCLNVMHCTLRESMAGDCVIDHASSIYRVMASQPIDCSLYRFILDRDSDTVASLTFDASGIHNANMTNA